MGNTLPVLSEFGSDICPIIPYLSRGRYLASVAVLGRPGPKRYRRDINLSIRLTRRGNGYNMRTGSPILGAMISTSGRLITISRNVLTKHGLAATRRLATRGRTGATELDSRPNGPAPVEILRKDSGRIPPVCARTRASRARVMVGCRRCARTSDRPAWNHDRSFAPNPPYPCLAGAKFARIGGEFLTPLRD